MPLTRGKWRETGQQSDSRIHNSDLEKETGEGRVYFPLNQRRGVGTRGGKCLRRVLFAEEAEDREVKEFRLHGEPEKVNSLPLVN